MERLILLLLLLFFIVSCNRNAKDSGHQADAKFTDAHLSLADSLAYLPILDPDSLITIKVPSGLDNPDHFIEATKVIGSIQYVPLETTRESIITGIERSIVYQDKIYILDIFGESILLFKKDGKFIRRIGRKGKGPKEYISPTSIDIDEKNQHLYVLDDKASKFLIFNLEGDFVREERVNFRLNDLEILDETTYVVNTDVSTNFHLPEISNNKLIFTDRKWKVFSKTFEYDAKNCSGVAFTRPGLYKFKDKVLYNPTLNYHIFTVTNEGLKPKFFIDAGKAMLPEGFEYQLSLDEFGVKYDNRISPYVFIRGPIVETDDYLLTFLRYGQRDVHFFYSKKSKQLFCSTDFRHEASRFRIIPTIKGISSSGEFYGFVDAVNFKNEVDFITEHNLGEIDAKLLTLPVDNNPIFVFYELKDF